MVLASPAIADERIFAQDRLFVRVLEWLPARGEYKAWQGVDGEYSVALDQSIQFPFVGKVPVAGRSPEELAGYLSSQLQQKMSLPLAPDVTVSFTVRAPVFVLGGVQTPGQVPYTEGLTPMKAVALSGGFFRGGGDLRLERDVIAANGALATAESEAASLLARIGRLDAELVDGAKVSVPKDAPPSVKVSESLLAQEQALLDVRLQGRNSQLESIRKRKELADQQTKTLRAQIDNLQTQADLINQELGSVKKLVNQGLATMGRSLTLERSSSELQGKRLEFDIALLQAQLESNQADRDAVDVVTKFKTECANELQEARALLVQRRTEIDVAQALLNEAITVAPEMLIERSGQMRAGIRFFLTRSVNGTPATVEVGRDEKLLGGDTIQIQIEPEDKKGSEGVGVVSR